MCILLTCYFLLSFSNSTSLQLLFGKIHDYFFLKVFGCSCFPCLRLYNTHKLNFRSLECIFIGYSPNHKGYKCLSLSGKVYVSKVVVFNEYNFPCLSKFFHNHSTLSLPFASSPVLSFQLFDDFFALSHNTTDCVTNSNVVCDQAGTRNTGSIDNLAAFDVVQHTGEITTSDNTIARAISIPSPLNQTDDNINEVHYESFRESPISNVIESVCNTNAHPMITRAKSSIVKPKVFVIDLIPKTSKQALSNEKWAAAI